jgi:hypothetical protein
MAEIWGALVVEFDRELPLPIRMGNGRRTLPAGERIALPHRTVAGHLRMPFVTVAVHNTLDSYGRETTIVYCGLGSFRDIQGYWLERDEVRRAFTERYSCDERDVDELFRRLDHTVRPLDVNLAAFARELGVVETIRAIA